MSRCIGVGEEPPHEYRRAFLKSVACAGTTLLLWPGVVFGEVDSFATDPATVEFDYQYRTLSVEHLRETKSVVDKLNREGKLSRQKTFQRYVGDLLFDAPKELPNARSVILVATPWKLRSITFRYKAKNHIVLVPGGYFVYEDERYIDALKQRIARDVLKNDGAKLVVAPVAAAPPLKALAVRSGLAEYGKNNIAYVDGYGSFHALWSIFTEHELPDQWSRPYRSMRFCKGCSICTKACPTKALPESTFVLDAGRCITLYNELNKPMPDGVDLKAHNALIGCLKCQYDCPANRHLIRQIEHLADITEEETALILSGQRNEKIQKSIGNKLKALGWYSAPENISRNLQMVLPNTSASEDLR